MNNLVKFQQLIINKQGLLKCIFTTLIFQIIVTTLVFNNVKANPKRYEYIINKTNATPFIIGLIILNILLIIGMTSLNINFYLKFLIFILFSAIQGVILGAALKYVDHTIINSALVSTLSIFVIFFIAGMITVYYGLNLSWIGIILFICLIFLIISRIVFLFVNKNKSTNRYITIFSLLLFSLYILYDTNHILMRLNSTNRDTDCINGALQYYLDILNIFTSSVSEE